MTMHLNFQNLWNTYPTADDLPHDTLFDNLGWSDLKTDPKYDNTCAIRMSLCLIRNKVDLPGRIKIKNNPYKDKLIEPGQVKLTNILASPRFLGEPQKFKLEKRDEILRDKQGIVSFMKIPSYVVDGALSGHIDLVKHGKFLFFWNTLLCPSGCHWNAQEFWFWAVK